METTKTEWITPEQLRELLANQKGATPVFITASTDPRLKKTNCPYYTENGESRVRKVSSANVFINFKYENSVNNQRLKEGIDEEFKAAPRAWGQRITGTSLIEHKGEYYLEARFLDSPVATVYVLDNSEEIPKERIEQWLPAAREDSGRQGTEKEIVLRDYKLSNVLEIKMNKKHYLILQTR